MAINAYTGLMGSGKSYEVVSSVIVPGVAAGRRVVANIDGLDEKAIFAYIEKKSLLKSGAILGSVLVVTDEQVKAPGFFPDETQPDRAAVVQPGDLVVIDEAWRHWAKGVRLAAEHMQFFRMHRHYTHPDTGAACDLALIFQSITDVHTALRSVIEMSFRTVRMKSLGLSKQYRLEVYEGDKMTKTSRLSNLIRKYDKAVFPLYKSYAGTAGKELVVDSRQNVFRAKKWIFPVFGGAVLLFVWGIWGVVGYFVRGDESLGAASASPAVTSVIPSVPSLSPGVPVSPSIDLAALRIVGSVTVHGVRFAVVSDGLGRYRYLNADQVRGGLGRQASLQVDGRTVTRYSGSGGVTLEVGR